MLTYPRFNIVRSTQSQIALLSDNGQVHIVTAQAGKWNAKPAAFGGESSQGTKLKLECRAVKKLDNIQMLESGPSHFLALRKVIVPSITEWNESQVADFITRIGFADAANVAIYNKVQGKTIAEFDEDFWSDTFGIYGVNELQKIRYEINRSHVKNFVSQELFGWGSNTFG